MQNGSASLDHLQPDDDDLLYEEELLRNPYSLKMWWRYLEARRDAPARKRYILYERALKALPVSYKVCQCPSAPAASHPDKPLERVSACEICLKYGWLLQLWHSYLRERQKAVRGLSVEDPTVVALNNTYERALVSMHKMPRIWLEYLVSRATPNQKIRCESSHRTRALSSLSMVCVSSWRAAGCLVALAGCRSF